MVLSNIAALLRIATPGPDPVLHGISNCVLLSRRSWSPFLDAPCTHLPRSAAVPDSAPTYPLKVISAVASIFAVSFTLTTLNIAAPVSAAFRDTVCNFVCLICRKIWLIKCCYRDFISRPGFTLLSSNTIIRRSDARDPCVSFAAVPFSGVPIYR